MTIKKGIDGYFISVSHLIIIRDIIRIAGDQTPNSWLLHVKVCESSH
jgi:hypothetical protein